MAYYRCADFLSIVSLDNDIIYYWKKETSEKQKKVSRNRTAPATHAIEPRFPGACGLPANDIRGWIDCA